jgi:ABC-type glutathione transport system ATPase component
MENVSETGRTVLFVSHNLGAINQLCGRCLLLDRGNLIADDITENVVSIYTKERIRNSELIDTKWEREGTGKVRIRSVILSDESSNTCNTFFMGQSIRLRLSGDAIAGDLGFNLAIQVVTVTEIPVLYMYDQFKTFVTSSKKKIFDRVGYTEITLDAGALFFTCLDWPSRLGGV